MNKDIIMDKQHTYDKIQENLFLGGLAYLFGINEKPNVKKAYMSFSKLLKNIEKGKSSTVLPFGAYFTLGYMLENGFYKKMNYNKAALFYLLGMKEAIIKYYNIFLFKINDAEKNNHLDKEILSLINKLIDTINIIYSELISNNKINKSSSFTYDIPNTFLTPISEIESNLNHDDKDIMLKYFVYNVYIKPNLNTKELSKHLTAFNRYGFLKYLFKVDIAIELKDNFSWPTFNENYKGLVTTFFDHVMKILENVCIEKVDNEVISKIKKDINLFLTSFHYVYKQMDAYPEYAEY